MALTNGLLSYWKADGNSTDSTGLNSGTDTGVTYVAGKIESAASFAGAGSISLSTTSALTNQFTFAFWMNCTNVTARQAVFTKSDGLGSATSAWDIEVGLTSGKISFLKWTGGTESRLTSTTSVVNNTWEHIICTYDGATMTLSINNGTPVTLASTGNINNITMATTWGRYGSFAGLFYSGLLDEMGVWNRPITASEKTQLYNGGAGLSHPFGVNSSSAWLAFFQ